MWNRLRRWLNEVPIENPIERRLSSLLQIFLFIGIIASIIGLYIQIDAFQMNNRQSLGILSPLVSLICYTIGLPLLRYGHFRLSIYLVTTSLILGLGIALIPVGIKSSAVTLL